MEDLQFDERLSWLKEALPGEFISSFIDPAELNVEDKMKFESLFDLLHETPGKTPVIY